MFDHFGSLSTNVRSNLETCRELSFEQDKYKHIFQSYSCSIGAGISTNQTDPKSCQESAPEAYIFFVVGHCAPDRSPDLEGLERLML